MYTAWKTKEQDVCQWPGITCTPQRSRVIGIHLSESLMPVEIYKKYSGGSLK
ncbi:BnaA02g11580D [Brassica napus]|uniref:(rape) hypothetical protein n=1 Tax=Brassica napus TaxID=3708 RepID=A0A078FTU0_BRANA|nr:unnamed protein product [Brassica napus]CDY16354.1 BnaA02g11580D [Brassica napus]